MAPRQILERLAVLAHEGARVSSVLHVHVAILQHGDVHAAECAAVEQPAEVGALGGRLPVVADRGVDEGAAVARRLGRFHDRPDDATRSQPVADAVEKVAAHRLVAEEHAVCGQRSKGG